MIIENIPELIGTPKLVEVATRHRRDFAVHFVEAWADCFAAEDDPEFDQESPEFIAALKAEAIRRLSEPAMLAAKYWLDRQYRWNNARQLQRLEDEYFLNQIEATVRALPAFMEKNDE